MFDFDSKYIDRIHYDVKEGQGFDILISKHFSLWEMYHVYEDSYASVMDGHTYHLQNHDSPKLPISIMFYIAPSRSNGPYRAICFGGQF